MQPPPPGMPPPPRYIPEELLLNILPRLPIKSAVRFRCVSRHWNSLLYNNREFAALFDRHHRHGHLACHAYLLTSLEYFPIPVPLRINPTPPPLEPPLLDLFHVDAPRNTSLRHIMAVVPEGHPPFHVEPPVPRVDGVMWRALGEAYLDIAVVGSIDGLFCLAYNRGSTVILWNPATRDSYQLPDPLLPILGFWTTTFGFACEHHNGQSCGPYKVVRVVFGKTSYLDENQMKAEMYDSSSNSWNEIADVPYERYSAPRCGVIVEGVPYWPGATKIISFHPRFEVFETFRIPDFDVDHGEGYYWSLGEVNGSLALLMQLSRQTYVDVWTRIKDCLDGVGWIRHLRVASVAGVRRWLSCWKDWEFLVSPPAEFWHKFSGELRGLDHLCMDKFLYDFQNQEYRMFPEFRHQKKSPLFEVFPYVETFVLPR